MARKKQSTQTGSHTPELKDQMEELTHRLQEETAKRERAEKVSRTVFDIAAAVNQVANLNELYRVIHQSLANVIDVTNFFIALYDKEKDTLSFPYFVDEMDAIEDYGQFNIQHISQSNMLSAEVIRTGKPLLIHKQEAVAYSRKISSTLPGTLPEVWLGVPLKIKNEIIGVICTQSYRDSMHFTEKDIEIMASVSDQVAVAIDHKRADEEAQHRARQADLLYVVGQKVGSKIKMEELLVAVVSTIQKAFGYSCVGIGLIDEEQRSIAYRAVAGRYTDIFAKNEVQGIEKGISGLAVRSGQTQLCGDVTKNPHYLRKADEATRSELSVPLKLGARVIGILDLQSDDCDAFDATDVSVLETLSTQIAAAIENARLFEDSHRRAERLAVINRIGNVAATAHNPDELMEAIYEEINTIFRPDAFFIAFLDHKTNMLEFGFLIEESKKQPFVKFPLGNGFSSKVILDKKPLIIRDYERDRHALPQGLIFGNQKPALSWIGVPLKYTDQIIGIVNIQSYQANAWNEEDIQLFFTIADQIAGTIEKARLFEEARVRAERLTVINRIGKVAAFADNLDKLMEAIYEEINRSFHPDCFFIGIIDDLKKNLEFRFLIENGSRLPNECQPIESGWSSKVIEDKKPLIILDLEKEQNNLPAPVQVGNDMPAFTWIGVPLAFEDQVIGLVNIQSTKRNAWSEEDIQLFFTIADQLAGIIAKARLYEALEQELNERKKAEEKKKELEAQLRQAQKMEAIGTMAGGIAHDFNNVLYPIIGFAEMTMDLVPVKSVAQKNLVEIITAADRAKDLIQQILTFSRRQEHNPQPMKIQSIIKEALKLMRSSMPATISLVQNINEQCGPIMADPSQVHQIIMNLCTNAYYAMRKQGGILEVALSEINIQPGFSKKAFQLYPGLSLCLTVRDTGDGIDPLILDRIFDPYFTTKPPGESTGMGLALVHGIVKSYGGEISVSSQPGKGTVFHICVPRIMENEKQTDILKQKCITGQGQTLLFVDDEKQIIDMVKQMLESLNYKVVVQMDSIEALHEFQRKPEQFDLVITDQTMPRMTGFELSRKMLAMRKDLPIILCTGFSDLVNEEQVHAIGIRKFILKPIMKSQLSVLVHEILNKT